MATRAAGPRRRWTVGVVAAALLSASAGCGGDDGIQVLTDEEIGSEVDVASGEQFEIRLESNPSTGYGWELSAMTTPDLVLLESRTHVAADTDSNGNPIGAPGTDVFVFTAVEGAGILRLEYVRSFDDPVVPERVAEFIVRVDGAEWPPSGGSVPPASTTAAP